MVCWFLLVWFFLIRLFIIGCRFLGVGIGVVWYVFFWEMRLNCFVWLVLFRKNGDFVCFEIVLVFLESF